MKLNFKSCDYCTSRNLCTGYSVGKNACEIFSVDEFMKDFSMKFEQPVPTPNNSKHIADMVVADIMQRKAAGVEKYGVALQAHNGRSALQDAYEEALDMACYLKQAIEESK